MIIETAIKRVYSNYERAKKRKDIQKPIAWALYKAWKWADEYEKPRGGYNEKNRERESKRNIDT